MSENKPVELRLLAGMQAGARMPLAPGRYRLGCGDDCDVILVGPGVGDLGATLTWDGDALLLRTGPLDSGPLDSADTPLMLGVPFRLADIWLCVDHADSPWPVAGSWNAVEPATTGGQAGPAPAQGGDRLAGGKPAALPTPARFVAWILGAFLVVLGGGAAGVWAVMPASTLAPKRAVAGDAARLQQVLKSLELSGRVQAQTDSAGQLVLHGFVPGAKELEGLQTRLANEGLQVPIAVHLDDVTLARVQALFKGQDWQVLSVQDGTVHLSGSASGQDPRPSLESRLREAGIPFRSLTLSTPPLSEARLRLEVLLQEAGLQGKLTLSVEGDQLRARGQLPPNELMLAQAAFARFNKETGGAVPFSADIDPPPGRLPFQIVQIVGGPAPYFVTEEGDRVLVGSVHRGYRLLSMRDGKMTFSGPQTVEVNW